MMLTPATYTLALARLGRALLVTASVMVSWMNLPKPILRSCWAVRIVARMTKTAACADTFVATCCQRGSDLSIAPLSSSGAASILSASISMANRSVAARIIACSHFMSSTRDRCDRRHLAIPLNRSGSDAPA